MSIARCLILGGAGASLALQLRGRFAVMDIVVVERRAHPVPPAASRRIDGAHIISRRRWVCARTWTRRTQVQPAFFNSQ